MNTSALIAFELSSSWAAAGCAAPNDSPTTIATNNLRKASFVNIARSLVVSYFRLCVPLRSSVSLRLFVFAVLSPQRRRGPQRYAENIVKFRQHPLLASVRFMRQLNKIHQHLTTAFHQRQFCCFVSSAFG